MPLELPSHFQTMYDANWRHIVQFGDQSELAPTVRNETVNGKELAIAYLGKVSVRPVTTRLGATTWQSIDHPKRWLRPRPWESTLPIDLFDKDGLGTLAEPKNAYQVAQLKAFNRKKDELILAAATGTAYTGEQGTTAVTLPAGQQVAVNYVTSGAAANSGLTLGKILRMKFLMDRANVGPKRVLAIEAQQLQDMLANIDQVNSSDYANVKALVDGKVDYFAGFRFKRVGIEEFTAAGLYNSSTDVLTAVAYEEDGVALGIGSDMQVFIDRRPDMNQAWQVQTFMNLDAARLEESCVVTALCDCSP